VYRNRREFLRTCCQLGAAGVGSQLARLGLVSTYAQGASDYKALVCVFLFGGNDANNMVVPIDSRYAAYQTMRGPVALAPGALLPAGASGYGLHPALTTIQRLYSEQRAALTLNVGTLVQPTTRSELDNIALPRNLYSHSDQTQQWQSSDPNGGGTGWGGRINDVIAALNSGALPPGITVNGGNALFLSGPVTKGVNFSNAGSFGLDTFGSGQAMSARVDSLQRLLTFDTGLKLVSAANGVLEDSFEAAEEINAALNSAPPLPIAFPGSGLGQQLAQVAQIIAVRSALGMTRQIFFAGMGGFDNHEDLLNRHQDLMATFNGAVGAFMDTLDVWGVTNQVTLFTESEFNRTGNANANVGTDHAWGGHHIVMGGGVQGGQTYGVFPVHQLSGPDDAGNRGNWIPTTSLDQYAATLGSWFGVADADLDQIFPNLRNFPTRNLGFVQIAPDLYRAQNDNHYTVFLVTPDGIIMTDPINRDFSTWLKGEIQKRHNRPVRYVLYTHHDWDHASGGAVFADTAQFIAHENFPATLTVPAGNLALPANAVKMDANRNGRVERAEATGGLQAQFDLTDANKDNALSGAEILRGPLNDVHPPTTTFADRHTVTLGGKTAEMIYLGIAHAPDSAVIHFPKERVVFGADTLQVRRFPGGVTPTIGAWIDAIRLVEKLDFDVAATGHALAGKKADIVALRQYLEELANGVAAGVAAGKSLKEIQDSLTFEKYKDWERYGVQPQIHIGQVYATLKGSN
jgi:uncharacterized protein (DUF1501 family)/glyoxylase-like metal-dependent hydrolase (beta-lactamase superfamily II)